MRRSSKILLTILMIFLMIFGLTGCTKATPKNLLNSMAKKTKDIESCEMNMIMDMSMSGSESGITFDVALKMDLDMGIITSPMAMKGSGHVTIELLDQQQAIDMEMYGEEEAGKYVSYAGSDTMGWTKTKEDLPSVGDYTLTGLEAFYESFTLEEELQTINDEECFVLKGNLEGEALEALMNIGINGMGDTADLLDGADWENASLPVELYIAKKTQYPARITMDMAPLMEGAMDELGVSVDGCTMEINYTSFNDVEPIEIPQEIKDQATEADMDSDLFGEEDLIEEDLIEEGEVSKEALKGVAQKEKLADKWTDMTISVQGRVVTLPCTYEEFKAVGLEIDGYESSEEETIIAADDYDFIDFVLAADDNYAFVSTTIYNTGDAPNTLKNCLVGALSYSYYGGEEKLEIVLPKNITIGSTKEEAIAAYGEPSLEDEESLAWYLDEDERTLSLYLGLEDDGTISYISLDANN